MTIRGIGSLSIEGEGAYCAGRPAEPSPARCLRWRPERTALSSALDRQFDEVPLGVQNSGFVVAVAGEARLRLDRHALPA
jgi:hypothetical protein